MPPTCFIIQPFDSGKFDRRFTEVYKPAVEEAGLEPYRVDHDQIVEVPIDAIEQGISRAAICLADISEDNPNVWYELGFAFAANRPVIMICSDERKGNYPFDIQHRNIISYKSDSPSDFEQLRRQICERAKALTTKSLLLKRAAETDQTAPTQGLSQQEKILLEVLAGDTALPESTVPLFSLQRDTEQAGLTPLAFGLAIRRLMKREFVRTQTESDPNSYDDYPAVQVTTHGWDWIEENEQEFILHQTKSTRSIDLDEDIPFPAYP